MLPDSEALLHEQAEQASKQRSSSTDISDRSEGLQGAVQSTAPADESYEPEIGQATQQHQGSAPQLAPLPVLDRSDADAVLAARPSESPAPELPDDASGEAPSDESEEEEDGVDGPDERAAGMYARLRQAQCSLSPTCLRHRVEHGRAGLSGTWWFQVVKSLRLSHRTATVCVPAPRQLQSRPLCPRSTFFMPKLRVPGAAQHDSSPRQRRASALAASKKVSDYIVQGSKSIRVCLGLVAVQPACCSLLYELGW